MGQPDLYPFVLNPPVVEKLGFIHRLIAGDIDRQAEVPAPELPALQDAD